MKKPPAHPDDPRIVHYTTDTGDEQVFAITPENFHPADVSATARMQQEPIHGFRVHVSGDRSLFLVSRNGVQLTHNALTVEFPLLRLETTMLTLLADEALLLVVADLERCAAIALSELALRHLYGKRGAGG